LYAQSAIATDLKMIYSKLVKKGIAIATKIFTNKMSVIRFSQEGEI